MRRHKSAKPTSTLLDLWKMIRHPRPCPSCGNHTHLFTFPGLPGSEELCGYCGNRLSIEIQRIKDRAAAKATS